MLANWKLKILLFWCSICVGELLQDVCERDGSGRDYEMGMPHKIASNNK
jgi:hypothetical protein